MRRTLFAAALCGLLLAGAGCGSTSDADGSQTSSVATPTTAPPTAATTAPPDYSADTKKVCARLEKIFDADLENFGAELGKMIAYKEAKQADNAKTAQQAASKKLKGVSAQVRKETTAAQDPELKEAGASTAARLAKSASDTRFFDGIKAEKDLDKILQNAMTNWLTPVAGRCA